MTIPHLIPRLLTRLKKVPQPQSIRPLQRKSRRRRSLRAPLPNEPDFNSHRQSSILLDPVNPISTPKAYVPHKSLPPRILLPPHDVDRQDAGNRPELVDDEYDRPREMTTQEKEWFANPYCKSIQFWRE